MSDLIGFVIFAILIAACVYVAHHGATDTAQTLGGLARSFLDGMK